MQSSPRTFNCSLAFVIRPTARLSPRSAVSHVEELGIAVQVPIVHWNCTVEFHFVELVLLVTRRDRTLRYSIRISLAQLVRQIYVRNFVWHVDLLIHMYSDYKWRWIEWVYICSGQTQTCIHLWFRWMYSERRRVNVGIFQLLDDGEPWRAHHNNVVRNKYTHRTGKQAETTTTTIDMHTRTHKCQQTIETSARI